MRVPARLVPVLPALLALIGALDPVPRPASAATLLAQSRTITLDTNTQLFGFTCLTPGLEIGCPVLLQDTNATAAASAPSFSPFDEVVVSAIGEVSQVSPLSGMSVDVTAAVDLAGRAALLCGPPGYPPCAPGYVAVRRFEQGSGASTTEVDFALDVATTVRLDGFATLVGDDDNGWAWADGAIEIELGPLGGPPVVDELLQLTRPLAPLNLPIDHEMALPAGVYRLRVDLSGGVVAYNVEPYGFPAVSGVTAQVDLDLQFVPPPAPVPSPAAAWPGRLLLGLALILAAARRPRTRGRRGALGSGGPTLA